MRVRSSPRPPRVRRSRLLGETLEPRRLLTFDPTPFEQALLEDLNRMRMDPAGELDVLFSSLNPLLARDAESQRAIQYFGVDRTTLLSQWSQLTAVPPLAWNEQLTLAAELHNQMMLQHDEQSHQLEGEASLGDRVLAAGYDFRLATENVYAFAESHLHTHGGFAVDWGDTATGIQQPPGHRINMMDADVVEVGIDVLRDPSLTNSVGPYLVTQDFGQPMRARNPFVLGVVWTDLDSNGIYDPGEGLSDVLLTITGGGQARTTTSMTAGGYQLRVVPGTYQVHATGGSLGDLELTSTVTVGSVNAKVDFETDLTPAAPVAGSDQFSTTEDTAGQFSILANDSATGSSLDPTSVTLSVPPTHGTVTFDNSGLATYRPQQDYFGADAFQYTVRNASGVVSNPAVVNIQVSSINDAPRATNVAVSTAGGTTVSIALRDSLSDVDSSIDWDTLQLTSRPTVGSYEIDPTNATVRYSAPANHSGTVVMAYRVADTAGLWSNTATITVNVASSGPAPGSTDDFFAVYGADLVTLPVLANDGAGSTATGNSVLIARQPSFGTLTVSGQTVRYQATAGFTGEDSFSYRVRNSSGVVSDAADVRLLVTSSSARWRNPLRASDVNLDGSVSPLDALLVINELGTDLPSHTVGQPLAAPPLLDVSGDQALSPLDALLVINELGQPVAALSGSATIRVMAASNNARSNNVASDVRLPVAERAAASETRSLPVARHATSGRSVSSRRGNPAAEDEPESFVIEQADPFA